MKVTTGLEYKELCEKIDSPTLERDLNYLRETGENPAGYTREEIGLMLDYLKE